MMLRELEILQVADHPNIVKLYETYEDSLYLHLVMELCRGGNILEHVVQLGCLSEASAAEAMRKICMAVNHLHQLFICHRDIKPENCLYVSEDPGSELKLVDFGLSVKFSSNPLMKMISFVGTPYYMAPEVMRGYYTKECDLWSLGVILYLLLSGRQPFASSSIEELMPKVMAANYNFDGEDWSMISDSAKDLISSLLVIDPTERLSMANILDHRWFKLHNGASRVAVPVSIVDLLKRKCALKQFQRESMKVILKYLSTLEIERLKVPPKQMIFHALDHKNTGFITAEDIAESMHRSGFDVAEQEINSRLYLGIISNYGLGARRISYSDFLIATLDWKALIDNEALWAAFCHFDRDKDGKIDATDFNQGLETAGCHLTEFEAMGLAKRIKGSKQIDFYAFKKIVMQLNETSLEFSPLHTINQSRCDVPFSLRVNDMSGDAPPDKMKTGEFEDQTENESE